VLGSLFPGSSTGALRILPLAGSVAAWSRTYDVTGSGTLGQGVIAVPEGDLAAAGGVSAMAGLQGGPATRRWFHTNLGLANLSQDPAAVTVKLFRGNGRLLTSIPVELPGQSWSQLLRVFKKVTVAPVADGFALVEAAPGEGPVAAWASVIDDLSGDPSFRLAREVPTGAE